MTAPSLTVRPAESRPILLPEEAHEPAAAADPALAGQLAALEASARQGHDHFAEAQASTERAVAAAAGSAPGSENWTVAQQSLSALETARTPARDAAAAVDALQTDPANAGPAARAAVTATAARIHDWEQSEAQTVAALTARLS